MENINEKLKFTEIVFEESCEKMAECDFIVPDYYPDILQVVTTEAVPHLRTKKISDKKLTLEGFIEYRVFYISENTDKLCSISYPEDFMFSFDNAGDDEDTFIKVSMIPVTAVSKAINKRKLAPKCSISFNVKVWAKNEIPAVNIEELKDIEMKSDDIMVFNMPASTQKMLSLSEDVAIPDSMPEATVLLRNECFTIINDIKTMANKTVIKGNAVVKFLYMNTEDNLSETEFELPFTHILDMSGIEENSDCDASYDVTDIICSLKQDENDENRIISIDIELTVNARILQNETVKIVSDAYSTTFNCVLQTNMIKCEKIVMKNKDIYINKTDVKLDRNVSSILHTFANIRPISNEMTDGSYITNSEMNINIICKNAEGEIFAVVKKVMIPLNTPFNNNSDNIRFENELNIHALSCMIIDSNTVEIRSDIEMSSIGFSKEAVNAVRHVEVDEESVKQNSFTSLLTIYYGKKDECLWDIAKAYNTPMSAILTANDILDESLTEDNVLIIPKKVY